MGANHVAQKAGLEDSVDETLTYVAAIAADHPELSAPDMAREWIEGAIEAARWFEDVGAIAWQMISDYEHCMPHTILVNRAGDRFCDDSFHPAVIKGVMASTADGLVSWAANLGELAVALDIDPEGLISTVERFNTHAEWGDDPKFGCGTNASVRTFRGDGDQKPNPNVGPLVDAPFHRMRMRLLNTGIAAGECVTRTTGGSAGYNSGYSVLSWVSCPEPTQPPWHPRHRNPLRPRHCRLSRRRDPVELQQ